ncbi:MULTISPECIES: sugar porter family MFS transporter [unclassified Cryobacterium]|uniref:sugar porter family MFS transporter n=1 Tax=unclassified Cryobacterium TaxID=2649013 RepID=UPI00106B3B10|nr:MULTISPECIES: sugar porter family MFS transporter [unclassified Cryobacterium]TFD04667.1 MFS transporter [Cryobacterium sp. TMT1-66-1]TFD08385.1 MFS transporter [Cryobacterium sp. TMT1-2-2]
MTASVKATDLAAPSTNRKVIALAVAGALGGFLFGFDSSVINGAVNAVQQEFGLNATLTGFAVACALLGAAAGAFFGGRFADRYGRIPMMVLGGVVFLISSIGSGFAFGVVDLIVWRVVGGLGIGLASVVAPAYIAEISPRQMRGRLGSLQQLAITLGIFTALLSDAVFAESAGGAGSEFWFGLEAWRWMFLAGAVPAIVYGGIAFILPESPRFLILKDKETDARAVFTRLWPSGDVDREIRDMRRSIEVDARSHKSGSLRGRAFGLKPIVWVGIILSVFQQFVGINVIFYYSTTLWSAVGFAESNSLTISVITSVTNILVTLVAIALVDRIGRRPILLAGSIGMTVSLATMAVAFSQSVTVDGELSLPGAWAPIALVAANLFVISFGASWGPVVWVLLGEMFPNSIRAKALGLAAAAQWIANFLITVSFPPMADVSLPITYGLYALFAGLSFWFVLRKVPETNGMSLEEADTLLPPKNSARKTTATN